MSRLAAVVFAGLVLVGGCSSTPSPTSSTASGSNPAVIGGAITTDTARSSSGPGSSPAPGQTLRVLVTNDDGIGAPGIDALVEMVRSMPNTEVSLAAPATNQSGTAEKKSDPPPSTLPGATRSGFEGTAVEGTPADSVLWALNGGLPQRPHVTVSGINLGQNVGTVISLSGTVGAARTSAKAGVPALAVSQGVGQGLTYTKAAELVKEWLERNRAELLARPATDTGPAEVDNLNVPTCTSGTVRGKVEVPPAVDETSGSPLGLADCLSAITDPKDDVQAINNGWASMSAIGACAPPSAPVRNLCQPAT